METAAIAMDLHPAKFSPHYAVWGGDNKQRSKTNISMIPSLLVAFPVLDVVISTMVVATTTAATYLVTSPASTAELQLLLVPLIGAIIASGGMIMLNPKPETRKIVIGRAVIALFLATISPQIIAILFTGYADFLSHPVVLLGAGGLLCMVFFAVSLPFCQGLYRRSGQMADLAIKSAEGALLGKVGAVVEDKINGKIERAAVVQTIVAHQQAKEVLAVAASTAAEVLKTAAETSAQTQKLTP